MGEEKRQASDRPQSAGCRGGFEGGARGCLTSPSEAHIEKLSGLSCGLGQGPWVKRRGRLRTGHREAAAGLPAAEEGLRAGPVGV